MEMPPTRIRIPIGLEIRIGSKDRDDVYEESLSQWVDEFELIFE